MYIDLLSLAAAVKDPPLTTNENQDYSYAGRELIIDIQFSG